ncbi:tRNA (guanine(10)-N2)-methyltransferase homolog [Striga asiatica]|uniref:tRNA (Guanine(10)-N2)-methyltransferase homolog n=1 Tax=Striga asiatica TaxID=4170 RepID=A0A5A7R8E8_STRAF|nr:tRNA (guanine(10)-N2)-methyltransferase homolog [Striga asiatica]
MIRRSAFLQSRLAFPLHFPHLLPNPTIVGRHQPPYRCLYLLRPHNILRRRALPGKKILPIIYPNRLRNSELPHQQKRVHLLLRAQWERGHGHAVPYALERRCETKPPTATWASTATCGAHPITFPTVEVRSKNPSGRTFPKSSYSVGGTNTPPGLPGPPGFLSDQMNRAPLCSKPAAISATWARSKLPIVPKQRNTTDLSGCLSSHSFNSPSRHRAHRVHPRHPPVVFYGLEREGLEPFECVDHDPPRVHHSLEVAEGSRENWAARDDVGGQHFSRNRARKAGDGQVEARVLVPGEVFAFFEFEGDEVVEEAECRRARREVDVRREAELISYLGEDGAEHVEDEARDKRAHLPGPTGDEARDGFLDVGLAGVDKVNHGYAVGGWREVVVREVG